MTDQTPNLALDYLMPEQAQKHITINDSLRRLDGLVQLSVASRGLASPPPAPQNGERYLLPQNAGGEWAGQGGNIAIWEDSGWAFIAPQAGWRLWDAATKTFLVYDGTSWGEVGSGGGLGVQTISETINLATPSTITIPSHSLFFGLAGRVVQRLQGATRWRIGVAADNQRFGSALSTATDTTLQGLADPPAVYWSPTPLLISGERGTLRGGEIKLVLYYLTLPIPD